MNGYAMEVFAEAQMQERLEEAANRRLLRDAAATGSTNKMPRLSTASRINKARHSISAIFVAQSSRLL